MSNDTIDYGKIIKTLRTKYKMTQTELGEKLSLGKTAISNYETGYSIPSAHILENIANIFDMNLIDFLTYNNTDNADSFMMPRLNQPINDKVIPYLKEANVTKTVIDAENYMDSYITMPSFMFEEDGKHICVKMPDNSMDGDNIKKNDYIIVRKSKIIENRRIVLAINNITGDYLVRRYIRDGHIASLVPSSASIKYSIIRADERDEQIEIIGYVDKVISSVK